MSVASPVSEKEGDESLSEEDESIDSKESLDQQSDESNDNSDSKTVS